MAIYKNVFNSGELSPRLWGRTDLVHYANGIAMGLNFIPQIEGSLRKRPGFLFNGLPKLANQKCKLIEFIRAKDEAYVIELGNLYARIWGVNGVRIGSVEVATSFSSDDLEGLRYKQLGAIIVFFHKDGRAPKRLEKVSETSWNFSDFIFQDGPWATENIDAAKVITVSNYVGTVTVSANFPLFESGMEGSYLRLRSSTGLPGIKTWRSDEDIYPSSLRLSNGRVYAGLDEPSTAKTGTTPPSHDRGRVSDGNVFWDYIHDGAGIVQINTILSPNQAFGSVIKTLPVLGVKTANDFQLLGDTSYVLSTSVWAEGLYSNHRGWPSAWPELREERLIVGGGRSSPDKYAMTQTAGYYANKGLFAPGLGTGLVLDDDAIQGFCGDDSFKALWFSSGPLLIVGTHGGLSAIVGGTAETPLTPNGSTPRPLLSYGVADVRPVKVQDGFVFVAKGAKALRDVAASAYDFPGQSNDLSFVARHITDRGISEIVYVSEPDYQFWCRLSDGGLANFVYNKEQGIRAWTRQALGGTLEVESLCVVPDPSGLDRLWCVGKRIKGGAVQRLILMLSVADDLVRLDGARIYNGAATNSIGGLEYLEGESVLILAGNGDGKYVEYNSIVVGGHASMPSGIAYGHIMAGLPYQTRFESLSLTVQGRDNKPIKIVGADAFLDGVTPRAGVVGFAPLDIIKGRPFDETQGIGVRSIVHGFVFESDHGPDPRIVIEDTTGFDLEIKAINLKVVRGE